MLKVSILINMFKMYQRYNWENTGCAGREKNGLNLFFRGTLKIIITF